MTVKGISLYLCRRIRICPQDAYPGKYIMRTAFKHGKHLICFFLCPWFSKHTTVHSNHGICTDHCVFRVLITVSAVHIFCLHTRQPFDQLLWCQILQLFRWNLLLRRRYAYFIFISTQRQDLLSAWRL